MSEVEQEPNPVVRAISDLVGSATKGRITNWRVGGPDDWCELSIDLGIVQAVVPMTSREAREFALAVLEEQGPYLGYQPPNENMRERPTMGAFSTSSAQRGEPGWKKRQKVKICHDRLTALLDEFGEETFGWAMGRLDG